MCIWNIRAASRASSSRQRRLSRTNGSPGRCSRAPAIALLSRHRWVPTRFSHEPKATDLRRSNAIPCCTGHGRPRWERGRGLTPERGATRALHTRGCVTFCMTLWSEAEAAECFTCSLASTASWPSDAGTARRGTPAVEGRSGKGRPALGVHPLRVLLHQLPQLLVEQRPLPGARGAAGSLPLDRR